MKITKRIINDVSIELFNQSLSSENWENVLQIKSTNKAYDNFLQILQKHYNNAFPEITKIIKSKIYLNPLITTGILKSSKKKQHLYEKLLKKRTFDDESNYKKYEGIFELVINRSKKIYYSNQLLKFKDDTQKTWNVIKELIGKKKLSTTCLPKTINFNGVDILNESKIAKTFNQVFVSVGSNLALKLKFGKFSVETQLTTIFY